MRGQLGQTVYNYLVIIISNFTNLNLKYVPSAQLLVSDIIHHVLDGNDYFLPLPTEIHSRNYPCINQYVSIRLHYEVVVIGYNCKESYQVPINLVKSCCILLVLCR